MLTLNSSSMISASCSLGSTDNVLSVATRTSSDDDVLLSVVCTMAVLPSISVDGGVAVEGPAVDALEFRDIEDLGTPETWPKEVCCDVDYFDVNNVTRPSSFCSVGQHV